MGSFKTLVGNVEVISLSDGTVELPASNVFPNVSSSEWDQHPERGASSEGVLTINFGSFVLRSQDQIILVDTGKGPDFSGRLLQELKAKGIGQDEIDVVAFTHLHPDHIGWNITWEGDQPIRTFPKANYWVPKGDWDHYLQPHELSRAPLFKTMVLPLEQLGALELVAEETSITSEVTMVPTPGHTPGHMSVSILSKGHRGFILGDVVLFPVQAQETGWETVFDYDHDQSRRTREAVLERLEIGGDLVGAGHFMPPSFGRFIRSEGRRYWEGV